MTDNPIWRWFDDIFLDLGRQFRWSYLPPLMVYLAAGVSGLTAIVGTFFIKEYLDLSAAFLAGLAFWAGIPWILKMPIGHLVDLLWRRKSLLVYLGASLIAVSILIMYGVIVHTAEMATVLNAEVWFVIATILAPTGYVLQDVVADAMTVEAVPTIDEHGDPYPEREIKIMHTTMQTLGLEYHHVRWCRRHVRGSQNSRLRQNLSTRPDHPADIDHGRHPRWHIVAPAGAPDGGARP